MLLCHCVGRNVLTSLLTDAANGHCLCACVCVYVVVYKCGFVHTMIYLEVKGQCIGSCRFFFFKSCFSRHSLYCFYCCRGLYTLLLIVYIKLLILNYFFLETGFLCVPMAFLGITL